MVSCVGTVGGAYILRIGKGVKSLWLQAIPYRTAHGYIFLSPPPNIHFRDSSINYSRRSIGDNTNKQYKHVMEIKELHKVAWWNYKSISHGSLANTILSRWEFYVSGWLWISEDPATLGLSSRKRFNRVSEMFIKPLGRQSH